MDNNQINFCLVLLSQTLKHFQKMAENGVNHINKFFFSPENVHKNLYLSLIHIH
jgi:hypothetical protein